MNSNVSKSNDDDEAVAELAELDADGPAALLRETERIVRDNVVDRPEVEWVPPSHVLAQVLRPGDQLEVLDLEHHREEPVRSRGAYTVFDAASFVTLVKRLQHDQTTLWAHQPSTGATSPSITAVLNDASDVEHGGAPGWRDHRATLVVRVDPDWAAWAGVDGNPVEQVAFAEFIGDHLHNIIDPPAAGLVGAITTFNVKRNVTFRQAVNLDSGEQQFTWIEQDENAGTVTLPTELQLRMRPYFGADPVDLTVALRHRVSKEGGLTFHIVRIRPDLAEEKAWEVVAGNVAAELPDVPVLQGSAPASLRS